MMVVSRRGEVERWPHRQQRAARNQSTASSKYIGDAASYGAASDDRQQMPVAECLGRWTLCGLGS